MVSLNTEEINVKKQIWVDALTYLICFVVACLLNLATSWLFLKIADSIVVLDYFGQSVIRIVSGFLTGGVIIGAIVARESYKSIEVHPIPLMAAIGLAGVGHLLLCLVLMFYPFIAGGVRDLAGVIGMGTEFSSEADIENIYLWQYLLAFVIDLAYKMGVAILCAYMGKAKRLKNRETIKGYSQ